uniref:SFRICE_002697 n=1 Tax=Spodoptera frugiperda TaxID=7108 RepID=A0A2H1VJV6_SPOFR
MDGWTRQFSESEVKCRRAILRHGRVLPRPHRKPTICSRYNHENTGKLMSGASQGHEQLSWIPQRNKSEHIIRGEVSNFSARYHHCRAGSYTLHGDGTKDAWLASLLSIHRILKLRIFLAHSLLSVEIRGHIVSQNCHYIFVAKGFYQLRNSNHCLTIELTNSQQQSTKDTK